MSPEIYEVLSLGARYWFALLSVLIVWRTFSWLRKDRQAKHRRLRYLPDAGMIGEMAVLTGSKELPEGVSLPVPREGTLGFLRTCDLVVPVPGVRKQHLDFAFVNGDGLYVRPFHGCTCTIDGQTITARTPRPERMMVHGSILTVGEAVLCLHVFAGLETERSARFQMVEGEDPMPLQDPLQEDYENPLMDPDWVMPDFSHTMPFTPIHDDEATPRRRRRRVDRYEQEKEDLYGESR